MNIATLSVLPESQQVPRAAAKECVTIRNLDDDYVPVGQPLELDHCALAGDGFGAGTVIVFRSVNLEVAPGRRYFVEVSIDGGKTIAHRHVHEFCAAVAGSAAK